MFSPVALRRMVPISLGETDTGVVSLLAPYSTPGISPRLRRRRLTFFPVSVLFSAATTISGMS